MICFKLSFKRNFVAILSMLIFFYLHIILHDI